MDRTMVLGLRTVIYHVPDLQRAKDWYRAAFGIDPYFDEPFYVGFNIGGFELGLDPDTTGAKPGPGGTVVDPFGNLVGLIENPHYVAA